MNALITLVVAGVMAATTPTVPPDVVKGDVGDAVLVTYNGSVVNSGKGTTKFFVVAPDGASCPGDSAHDQWRINTFLVPENDDILGIWFGSSGPEPPWNGQRYPMFDNSNGLALSQIMLQQNQVAGQPALVDQVHETSFSVHAQNDIRSGRYRVGIACSYFRQTTQYWDLIVDITAGAGNDPAALRWRVVSGRGASVPTAPVDKALWLGRGLIAVGALIVLALVLTRRRPSPAEGRVALKRHRARIRPRLRSRSHAKEYSS